MTRHQGKYNPENTGPYELSRSRIENFVRCKACFYMQQVEGVAFPSIPGFNINEAADVLLKRDFDSYRQKQMPHPFLVALGMDNLIPFAHQDFDLWTQSLHFGAKDRLNTVHEESNLKVGGGLDDVWLDISTDKLHVVDYKSTSLRTPDKTITLDDKWKDSYKRQMELYVWVLRRKGFDVSGTGYFLYCDGDRFSEYEFLGSSGASMRFKMSLITHQVAVEWIESTLMAIRQCLDGDGRPLHSNGCEFGRFLEVAS